MINLPLTFTISTLDFFYRKYRVHVHVYLLLYRIYMFTSCPQLTSIQDIRTQPRVPPSPPLSSQVYGQHQCQLSCPCYTLVYWESIMFYGVCGPGLYLWGHPFNLSLWHNPPHSVSEWFTLPVSSQAFHNDHSLSSLTIYP